MSIRHSQLMLDTKNIHICKPNKIPISNSEYGLTLEYTTERERENVVVRSFKDGRISIRINR